LPLKYDVPIGIRMRLRVNTRCSLPVTDLGAPTKTALQ